MHTDIVVTLKDFAIILEISNLHGVSVLFQNQQFPQVKVKVLQFFHLVFTHFNRLSV